MAAIKDLLIELKACDERQRAMELADALWDAAGDDPDLTLAERREIEDEVQAKLKALGLE